ncbi:hypothetical protein [Desulfosarcina ovata]|uniref:hypothetical protein n=1 Tax=Desulfosarcina ovata TaxID=83564 RepID=UPI0012D2BC82|nr:hypothetical protein [Desulfosarcina ovata]
MHLILEQALTDGQLILSDAKRAFEKNDIERALAILDVLDGIMPRMHALNYRSELLWRPVRMALGPKPFPSIDGEKRPTPPWGLILTVGKGIHFQVAIRRLLAQTRELRSDCLIKKALRALETLEPSGAEPHWQSAMRFSPLAEPLLDAGKRHGFMPASGIMLEIGPVWRLPLERGVCSLVPFGEGLLIATRRKNNRGLLLDVALDQVSPCGELLPVKLDRPVDLRPLPGGVSPMFSIARHPNSRELIFPEFCADNAIRLMAYDIFHSTRRVFSETMEPAMAGPFYVCSSNSRVWLVSRFSGGVTEFLPNGSILLRMEPPEGMLSPLRVEAFGETKRVVMCAHPRNTRRKYERFLGHTRNTLSDLWCWDVARDDVTAIELPDEYVSAPRFVTTVQGYWVIVTETFLHVLDESLRPCISLNLAAHLCRMFGLPYHADKVFSIACCQDGRTLYFAEYMVTGAVGSLQFNFAQ